MILHGDCLEKLRGMEADSVDSLVTDPPAGIAFMNSDWDKDKGGRDQWIAWLSSVMEECMRVMKPGSHGLVWAIPRTSHWTATALEDAGFEIRDVVTHLFGSGFPKSLDISKAIDKAAGAEREVIGRHIQSKQIRKPGTSLEGSRDGSLAWQHDITAPSTPEAKQWQGWGTALKPAAEMWILIRKPLSEKTVAANVLKHGCGGINIDASRIGTFKEGDPNRFIGQKKHSKTTYAQDDWTKENFKGLAINPNQGRFPANLVLSHNPDCVEVGTKEIKTDSHQADKTIGFGERKYNGKENEPERKYTETVAAWECTEGCAVRELDRQSGDRPVSGSAKLGKPHQGEFKAGFLGKAGQRSQRLSPNDSGGASRFFYCAKASKSDKGEGNTHPTVKSSKLMSYLITMITPPNGTVLDPFSGSGSTGVAAIQSGFKFIGIEKELDYVEIANKRIYHAFPEFKKQIKKEE